eukprot:Skav223412  [mRNA]  locus=scaffold350:144601:146855:- [translate_table: standard]
MAPCYLCKHRPGEADNLCPLCRSLHRVCQEVLKLPSDLHDWALLQSRNWCSIVQEEHYKRVGAKLHQVSAEATAKAKSAAQRIAAKSPTEGRLIEVKTEPEDEAENAGREESPPRARSSGIHRGRRGGRAADEGSRSENRSRSRKSHHRERREYRRTEREERRRDRSRTPVKRRKERDTSPESGNDRRDRRATPVRPREPSEPPRHWEGPIPARGKGKGRGRGHRGGRYPPPERLALRRPSGRERRGRDLPEEAVEAERSEEERWRGYEEIEADLVPLGLLEEGSAVVLKGTYWGGDCNLSGILAKMRIVGDRKAEVEVRPEGTENEALLRWITGNPGYPVKAHLCGSSCPSRVDASGMIHVSKMRQRKPDGDEGWMSNLRTPDDELARLRAAEEELRPQDIVGVDPKDGKDKKEKKEKKDKSSKKKKSSDSSSGSKKKKKKKKRKQGDRVEGQKSLEAVYKNTGLGPSPKVRKRIRRRVRRRLKKKKDSSSSSSSSSRDNKGEVASPSWDSQDSDGVFEESHKIRLIASRAPGVLTATTIKEMQKQLLTAQGTISDLDSSSIPSIALQYHRQKMEAKLSGGAARECLTLSWGLDLLLAGKVASCADALSQRIKSLELAANGSSWQVAQRIEVVPPERGQLSSRTEANVAAKENQEELKARLLDRGGKGKGRGDGAYPSWKGGGKTKSEDKGGRGKGKKGEKEEQKK